MKRISNSSNKGLSALIPYYHPLCFSSELRMDMEIYGVQAYDRFIGLLITVENYCLKNDCFVLFKVVETVKVCLKTNGKIVKMLIIKSYFQ